MRAFWAPQSALLLGDPPTLAPEFLLRRQMSRGRPVHLVYCGDRMWPALRHGQRCLVEPLGGEAVAEGVVVLAAPSGIPDLLRVDRVDQDELVLRGDADGTEVSRVRRQDVIGRADLPPRRTAGAWRALRRLAIDLREALGHGPDRDRDAAETVRFKYETQAPFYGDPQDAGMDGDLLARLRRHVPAGGRILVAGSGTGRECLALAEEGWRSVGIDFSPAMVALARREAARRGLSLDFHLADLREHAEPPRSLAGILFTYDVYSFIAGKRARIALLKGMSEWLKPGGAVFLSARRGRGAYDAFIVTLQRLAFRGGEERRWGASHTRWIAPDGTLHRSFVKVFTGASIEREIRRAGLVPGAWQGGHMLASVPQPAAPSSGPTGPRTPCRSRPLRSGR